MLMIRLQRVGKKNQAMFRLVLTDKQNGPKSGRFIELLGSYNPHDNKVQFDAEKIKHWISKGAQPSDTVHNLLVSEKIIDGKKINVLPKKTPIVKEAEESASAPEASETPAESAPEAQEAEPTEAPTAQAESESMESQPESVVKENPEETPAEPVEEKTEEAPKEEPKAEEPATEEVKEAPTS